MGCSIVKKFPGASGEVQGRFRELHRKARGDFATNSLAMLPVISPRHLPASETREPEASTTTTDGTTHSFHPLPPSRTLSNPLPETERNGYHGDQLRFMGLRRRANEHWGQEGGGPCRPAGSMCMP